jgi:hypothetical protein
MLIDKSIFRYFVITVEGLVLLLMVTLNLVKVVAVKESKSVVSKSFLACMPKPR